MRAQIKIMLLATCLAACYSEFECDIPVPSYAHNAESHYMKKESAKQFIFEIPEEVSADTVFDFYHDYYGSKGYKLCTEIKNNEKSGARNEPKEMSAFLKNESLVTVLKNPPYNFNSESEEGRGKSFMIIYYKPGENIKKTLNYLNISCDKE